MKESWEATTAEHPNPLPKQARLTLCMPSSLPWSVSPMARSMRLRRQLVRSSLAVPATAIWIALSPQSTALTVTSPALCVN